MLERFYNFFASSKKRKGVTAIVLGAFLMAVGPFFVEFSGVSAETNTFYRLLVGALSFIAFAVWKERVIISRQFLLIGMLGGALLVTDLFLWNQSVLYTGAGLATILSNLEIIFLVFIGKIYFSEQLPDKCVILGCFILLGIGALIWPVIFEDSSRNLLGICIALGASLSYALYLSSIKYISNNFPTKTPIAPLAVVCLTGCLLLGATIIILSPNKLIIPSWHSAICIFTNGILSQVLAWWLISIGVRNVSLFLSGALLLLPPAITFFLDCLFLARNTSWLQLMGSVCLLSSIYVVTKNQKSQGEPRETNY